MPRQSTTSSSQNFASASSASKAQAAVDARSFRLVLPRLIGACRATGLHSVRCMRSRAAATVRSTARRPHSFRRVLLHLEGQGALVRDAARSLRTGAGPGGAGAKPRHLCGGRRRKGASLLQKRAFATADLGPSLASSHVFR